MKNGLKNISGIGNNSNQIMTKSNKNIKTTQTLKNPVINNKLQNVLKINSFKNNNHLLDNISNSMSISYEKFPVNLHPTKGKRKENYHT